MKRRKRGVRKTLATLLALALCIGLLPGTVLAEANETAEPEEEIVTFSADDVGETEVEADTQDGAEEELVANTEDPETKDADPENAIKDLAASEEPEEEPGDDESEDEDPDEELMLLDGDAVVEVTVDGGTPEQYTSLADAIDAANAATGDEVTVTLLTDVTENVEEARHFTISRGMTFDLDDNTIYVTGTNTSSSSWRFFSIADSNLDLVTFCNGTVDGFPEGADEAANSVFLCAENTSGASYWHKINLENMTFQNFGAPPVTKIGCVGTVYVSGTDLTVENCTFQNNEMRGITVASKWASKPYTNISITDSTFTNNHNNATYDSSNIGFTSPQSYETGAYAGAFFIRYADTVDIKNNIITENSAEMTGGGFFIYYSENIDIEENTISGNYTRFADLGDRTTVYYNYSAGGGGFTIHGPIGDNVVIKNNQITDNSAYSLGGGFMIVHEDDVTHETYYSGDISIEGNEITGNTVLPFTDRNGDAASHGGGVALYDLERLYDSDEDNYSQVVLSNNKINNNTAGSGTNGNSTINRGGGISLYSATPNAGYKEKLEYIIKSGEISGNVADVGGGIDMTIGSDTLLQLHNTSIKNNTAVRGGGMWTNPSSVTDMNASEGAVIYNNTASGSITYSDGASYNACGDDIRHEASDSDLYEDGELTGTDAETEPDSELTILNLDLDQDNIDETYDWYTDETANRYNDASDKDSLLVDFGGSNSHTFTDSVSLHADLDADGADPDLVVSGNTAWAYGGGIASDGTVYFGDASSSSTHEGEVDVTDVTTSETESYDTLADAVEAANNIDSSDEVEITLNANITVDLDTDVDENSLYYARLTRGATLDLNSKSISAKGNNDDEHDHDKRILDIATSEEVTIKNGTISGRVRAAGSTMGYAIHSEGTADACNNLVIDNVKISSFGDPEYGTIYAKYCNLTITSSTISDNETRAFYFVGGTNADREASLIVDDCTFTLNKPANNENHYGGAFYAEYANAVTVKDSTISENGGSISDNSGAGSNYLYGGGGFYLSHCGIDGSDEEENITISGNTVYKNRAYSDDIKHLGDSTWEKVGGGGFKLYDVSGYVKISDNTVDSNHAYAFGGGISIQDDSYSKNADSQHLGDVDILDNEITNNTLYCYDSNANSHGGGIAVFDTAYTHGENGTVITFTGNKINENTSGIKQHNSSPMNSFQSKGGGIALCAYDDDTEFKFYSGEILNNEACSGGGVDCTFKQTSTVRFYNTVITENESTRGGGIWLCPTADFYIYETFGGAIYNNTASGTISYGSDSYPSCGDDIRYEGNDSDAIARLWNNQQEYDEWIAAGMPTEATVTSRALGGELYDWYTDGQNALYNGRNPYSGTALERYNSADDADELYVPLETILLTGVRNSDGTWDGYHKRSGSFSLHSELSDHAIELANEECTLMISGNTATYYGGGLAANTAVTFGYELDEDLTLQKSFQDEDGNEIPTMIEDTNGDLIPNPDLPEYIKVTLERFDDEGNEEDLETVELNPKNGWSYTFYELEHYYETVGDAEDPDEVFWHQWKYSVKEVAVKYYDSDDEDTDPGLMWSQKFETKEEDVDEDGNIDLITISLTNRKRQEPTITKEELEDDYERKDEDIEHDDENGHYEENIEGDGWGSWDDADNNQEVTYRLKLEHIKDTYQMTVHDYLEDGLDFEPETIDIWLYNGEEDTEGRELEEGDDKDYVVNMGDCSDPDCLMNGCTFEVRFADYLFEPEYAPDADEDTKALNDDAYVVIIYKAVTDTHAGDYFEGDHEYEDLILNDAYLTGYYFDGVAFRTPPIETETDLYGFGVYKYYEDENGQRQPLSGAQFILSEEGTREDGSTGTRYATFIQETDNGKIYYLTSGWVDEQEDAGILTSGADGYIRIEGLDDDTYVLTEVQAPAGYQALTDPITVVLGEDNTVTVDGNDSATKEEGVLHEFSVRNEEAMTDISGTKTWDDDNDQNGARPESITIHLLAGDTEIDSVTVTAADDWSWSFKGLPTHENGKKINYNVVETIVEDYTTTESGYDVINAYTPGKTGINARKIWDDNDDQDGERPESIAVELIKNGEATGQTITLDESNGWYGSFTDLDEYTDDGGKNEYSIEEVEVAPGYESRIGHVEDTPTFIITNSYASDTIEISGSKIWEDEDDKNDGRPDTIYVSLRNGEDIVQTVSVTEDDGWDWTFTDLPKYENGEEIEYTVTEEKVANYTAEITGDQEDGFEITNTYTPEKETKKDSGTTSGSGAPKTSDTNNLGAWLALMIACAVIVGDVFYIRRRRNKMK